MFFSGFFCHVLIGYNYGFFFIFTIILYTTELCNHNYTLDTVISYLISRGRIASTIKCFGSQQLHNSIDPFKLSSVKWIMLLHLCIIVKIVGMQLQLKGVGHGNEVLCGASAKKNLQWYNCFALIYLVSGDGLILVK